MHRENGRNKQVYCCSCAGGKSHGSDFRVDVIVEARSVNLVRTILSGKPQPKI